MKIKLFSTKIRTILQNSALLLVAVFVSVWIVEFLLHRFTPHPIGFKSNLTFDPVLGYRVNPNFPGIDSHGFRNPEGRKEGYVIATIGDSHTYSNNAELHESWPRRLEDMAEVPVYNYGIGSYGIYTYHPLVLQAIEEGAQAVIVGIYLGNDFGSRMMCTTIGFQSDFWQREIEVLELDVQFCGDPMYLELKRQSRRRLERFFPALHSFLGRELWQPYLKPMVRQLGLKFSNKPKCNKSKPRGFFDIPGTSEMILKRRLHSDIKKVDLNLERPKKNYDAFVKFAQTWKRLALENQIDLLFLLIPTKQSVLTTFATPEGAAIPREVADFFRLEQRVLDKITALAGELDIPVATPVPELMQAKRRLMQENLERGQLYPEGNGHPNAHGYQAYAEAALRLLQDACDQKLDGCSYLPSSVISPNPAL